MSLLLRNHRSSMEISNKFSGEYRVQVLLFKNLIENIYNVYCPKTMKPPFIRMGMILSTLDQRPSFLVLFMLIN